MDNELDELNDETFGDAEIGDWEMEHEKFVMEYDAEKLPPSPRNIPKIWETAELSDFWSAGDLEVSQTYDAVLDVVESVEKLVNENELEDPAILDASKFGLRPQSNEITPIPPIAKPSDMWSSPLSSNQPTASNQNRFQLSNNNAAPSIDIHLLVDRFKKDVSFTSEDTPAGSFPKLGCASLPREQDNYNVKNFEVPLQQPKPQPLISVPVTIPEQLQHLLASQSPQFLRSLMNMRALQQRFQQNQQIRSGLMSPTPSQTFNHQQFSTPPPPPLISSGPFPSPSSNSSLGFQFAKPFPLNPSHQAPGMQVMSQPTGQFNNIPLQHQMSRLTRRPLPPLPPAPSAPQPHGARLPPAKSARLREIFSDRIEDVQQNPGYFDLRCGPWMTPYEQVMVLNYQLRSYNCTNTYVDDYYCAVKWLRAMTRRREAQLADGLQVPQPYVFIQAPITASHLLSLDHHHRVAMRSSFIVRLVPRKKQYEPTGTTTTVPALPSSAAATEKLTSTTPTSEERSPDRQPKRPDSVASSVMTSASGLYSNQLGRPTKSNIKTQRIIADLSVATALDDEETQKEHFRTEAEEVASMLKDPSEKKVVLTTESEEVAAAIHQRNIEHGLVVNRRRRLTVLARIERLYGTVLSIDETNVSLARISVRNDESKHLMGHRLLLIRFLHRDLFIFNKARSESNEEKLDRRLAIEIFEAPKGIRVLPVILRYLFPEDRAFCMSEFMSNYATIDLGIPGGIDKYSQLLFTSFKDVVFKAVEDSPDFARSCLPIPFSEVSDYPATSTLNELLTGRLNDNVLAMFRSSFGLSLYYCLLEACLLKNVKETVILAGELLAYASRIVSILDSSLISLPMPLDAFPRVSAVEPAWIMRKDLFNSCADLHKYAGVFCQRASARNISKAAPGSFQIRQPQPPSQYNSQLQQQQPMFMRGLHLA